MGVSLRLIKPVTDEFGCQIVYIDLKKDTVPGVPKKGRKQNAHASIDGDLEKNKAYQIDAKHVKILLAQ